MSKQKPSTSQSRVTIVFECDSKDVSGRKWLSALELSNLVLGALLEQNLKMCIEEINNA